MIARFKRPAGEPWTCARCVDGQMLWCGTDATKDLQFIHHRVACNRCAYVECITEPREPDEEL